MTLKHLSIVIGGALASVSQLPAQAGTTCSGPGAALGVTAYQCASCGFKREKTGRATYTFNAEPVIMETTAASLLRPGDVIEAVAGKPITTAEGAEAFAYPLESTSASMGFGLAVLGHEPLIVIDGVVQPSGVREIVVRVRRNGRSLEITAPVRDRCLDDSTVEPGVGVEAKRMTRRDNAINRLGDLDPNDIERVEVLKGAAAATLYGPAATNGVIQIFTKRGRGEPGTAKPSTAPPAATEPTGRLGLALSCEPSCTRARARDGTDYWKFDGYPPIVALRSGGPAESVGLKVGDRVTDIDGMSILTEAGALRFLRAESKESMQVTVLRDGKKIGYLVSLKSNR